MKRKISPDFFADSFPGYCKVTAILHFILQSDLFWPTLSTCTGWTAGLESLGGVLEDPVQSPFIHCLSLDGHLEMLRGANFFFFFFGQFSVLYDRIQCCDFGTASTHPYHITQRQTTRLSSQSPSVVRGIKKATGKPAGVSGTRSVCACSVPSRFHLRAVCSHAECVFVHTCAAEQTLPGVARALAELSGAKGGGREGNGSRCNTKADLPDASFRLDPLWKLSAGINFWLGKRKGCFPLIVWEIERRERGWEERKRKGKTLP